MTAHLLRILIVDDEPLARERVRRLLAKVPDVTVVGEACNGREAFTFLEKQSADVLVLDIQMPELDGLRLLEALDDPPPVIFTTAYDHHAIRAFDLDAVDYVLKPFSAERLARAIDRARRRLGGLGGAAPQPVATSSQRIAVELGTSTRLLAPEEIALVRIVEGVVFVHTVEGQEFLAPGTLAEVEERLPPDQFARISRAAIVRLAEVVSWEPNDEGGLVLRLGNGLAESATRRRSGYLRERLSH